MARPPVSTLLDRPLAPALLGLALPVLASLVLRLGYQWVDALWVRGLGVEATAAVTTSVFVMWAVYSINDMISIGAVAYVTQLLGAGERARAGAAAGRALWGSAMLGLAGSAAGVLAAPVIAHLMGATGVEGVAATRYLRVVLGGAPLPMVMLTGEAIMRASGDTRTPLLVDLAAVGLNAALDPLLIYGAGSWHGLGVAGAAWATLLAQGLAASTYVILALRGHRALHIARRAPGPPIRLIALARVGLPAASIGLLFSVVYLAFVRSVAPLGAVAMAVVGVSNRIEALQFVVSMALGTACSTLVGQNLGAGRLDRAERTMHLGRVWITWASLALTAVTLLFPDALFGMFSHDPGLHRDGVPYLRVLASCFLFTGLEIVTVEALLASGHTAALSWIYNVISLARIPLAFAVARFGLTGLAWLISITCVVRTVTILGWAARGTWKRGLRRELQSLPVVDIEGP